MWYTHKLLSQHDACITEQYVHALLEEHRLKANQWFFMGWHPSQEWFSAPLPKIVRATGNTVRQMEAGLRAEGY